MKFFVSRPLSASALCTDLFPCNLRMSRIFRMLMGIHENKNMTENVAAGDMSSAARARYVHGVWSRRIAMALNFHCRIVLSISRFEFSTYSRSLDTWRQARIVIFHLALRSPVIFARGSFSQKFKMHFRRGGSAIRETSNRFSNVRSIFRPRRIHFKTIRQWTVEFSRCDVPPC